jgi:MoaA/NifB/PqqE/SkfB family radical SAM enzyme
MTFKKYLPKDSIDTNNVYQSICVNLTNTCNTRCKYCFQSAVKKETEFIKKNKLFEIIDFFDGKNKSQKKYFQLTGGETFLYPDIFEVIEYLKNRNWIIRFQTNGMLIPSFSKSELNIFKDVNISFRISLDGWNKATHEYFREKESFKKVVRGIETLREYSKNIVIKTVIHRENFKNLERLFDFCLKLGVIGISTNVLRLEGYAGKIINPDEIIFSESLYKKLVDLFNEEKYSHLIGGNDIAVYYIKKSRKLKKRIFYVDYTGDVFPHQTCLKNELIGNIYKEDIDKVFRENKLKEVVWGEVSKDIFSFILKNLRKEVFERWKFWYMQVATKQA